MERAFDADFTRKPTATARATASPRCSKPWFETRTLDEVRKALDAHGVCWGPYQTFTQLLDDDWRIAPTSPVFGDVDHPGIGTLRTPASPMKFPTEPPVAARSRTAPRHAHRRGARRRPGAVADRDRRAARRRRGRQRGARSRERRTHARRRRVRRARARPGATRAGGAPRRLPRRRPRGARPRAAARALALGAVPSRRCRPRASASTATRAGVPRWTSSRSACGSAGACASRDRCASASTPSASRGS